MFENHKPLIPFHANTKTCSHSNQKPDKWTCIKLESEVA